MARLTSGALPGRRTGDLPYDTQVLTATTAGVRAAPCKVAGFTCTVAGTVTIYANLANSGTVMFPTAACSAGQVVTFAQPYVSALGVSVTLAGGANIALSVQ